MSQTPESEDGRARQLYTAARSSSFPTWDELPRTTQLEFIRFVARPALQRVETDIRTLLRGLNFRG